MYTGPRQGNSVQLDDSFIQNVAALDERVSQLQRRFSSCTNDINQTAAAVERIRDQIAELDKRVSLQEHDAEYERAARSAYRRIVIALVLSGIGNVWAIAHTILKG